VAATSDPSSKGFKTEGLVGTDQDELLLLSTLVHYVSCTGGGGIASLVRIGHKLRLVQSAVIEIYLQADNTVVKALRQTENLRNAKDAGE